MPNNKQQHYVPKLHLKNFSSDKLSISIFSIKKGKFINNAPIKGQCKSSYFYGKNSSIDEIHCAIESSAASALHKILSLDNLRMANGDYQLFLYYICSLHMRTLAKYKQLMDTDNKILNFLNSNKKLSEKFSNQLFENPLLPEEIFFLPAMAFPIIMDMGRALLINKSTLPFVTSDHPVTLNNRYCAHDKTKFSVGYASSGLIIFLSISDNRALIFYDNNMYKTKGKIINLHDNKTVSQLNCITIRGAHENIYFKKNSTELERDIEKNIKQRREDDLKILPFGSGIMWKSTPAQQNFPVSILKNRIIKKYQQSRIANSVVRDSAWLDILADYIYHVWPEPPLYDSLFKFATSHTLWPLVENWKLEWKQKYIEIF